MDVLYANRSMLIGNNIIVHEKYGLRHCAMSNPLYMSCKSFCAVAERTRCAELFPEFRISGQAHIAH